MASTAKKPKPSTVKYTVDEYLIILRAAKRSEQTIEGYRKVLKSFADFLGVPLDEVHRHLLVSNLLKYAGSRNGKSAAGTKTNLSILHRYFKINGIVFDELQFNAVKHKIVKDPQDKPLELKTLQKMMDLTDTHGKAILTFLISTSCRAGETCKILVSDVKGDTVTIRPEIAKGLHGGKVYLSSEAQEWLDLWLRERDEYIRVADARTKGLAGKKNPHRAHPRPTNDQRLFAVSYTSMNRIFDRLYKKVDGERGPYQARCTLHSCRRYFRTHAVKSMPLDLVEGIMRHTGYLNSSYVRRTDEEKRQMFHDGEASLYITRADHRVQSGKLADLERKVADQEETKKLMDSILKTPEGQALIKKYQSK